MKSQNHICRCGKVKTRALGYEFCYDCNKKWQTEIGEREKARLKNHPAKNDPEFEFARKWNAKHPMVRSRLEAVENYRCYMGRVTV